MRILHTSDWHLGQHFMGKSREPEHKSFIQWLLKTIDEQQVDALLIAGDIFDTGTPPSYARTLYNQLIVNLQRTHCRHLIILGGNHDSVATLNESRELLAMLNTHVVGGVMDDLNHQVITLTDAENQPEAVVCAIPFIRPRDVIESRSGESDTDKQQALQNAIAEHYQQVFERAKKQQLPVIATGHLTTVGGQVTESVREIYIGTLKAFPVSAFPPADYIALGHLHRAQKVSDQDHIRYSGSPIPLSFDETPTDKLVLLIDINPEQKPVVSELAVPRFRPLHRLKGSLNGIEEQLDKLEETAANTGLTPWLEIEVSSDDYLSDLQSRIQALVSERPVEVLTVRRKRENTSPAFHYEQKETLDELQVSDVFHRRLNDEELEADRVEALNRAFNEILETLDEEPAQIKKETAA